MVDAGTLKRQTGESTNPTTGVVTPTYAAPYYTGALRVQLAETLAQVPESGGRTRTLQRLECQVPMSVTGVQVDDVLTVTASALDADLVGRTFRVRSLFHKTHATSRRLEVEEVQS